MPLLLGVPWIRMQPKIRSGPEHLEVTVRISWDPEHADELQVAVQVEDLVADELLSLRVSSVLARSDLAPALRLIGDEALGLIRRSANPFDDLL